jgi:hypothetical protein
LTEKQPLVYVKVKDLKWILPKTPEDNDRTTRTNLKAPILITEWNYKWVTVDGFHRVQKAVNENVEELPARIVSSIQLASA